LFQVLKEHCHDFKNVVVLQNYVGLVKGEPDSCSVSSGDSVEGINIKAEEATDIKEEDVREVVPFPLMDTEHEVGVCVCVDGS
jgi:hypothetical protein